MDLDLEKLNMSINNKASLNKNDLLVRELLELCSNNDEVSVDVLKKFNSNIFIQVYKELSEDNYSDMNILKDMIFGVYAKENIDYAKDYIFDDDDIY